MDQKSRLVIIGLVLITAVSLFLSYQSNGAKQLLLRERGALSKENETLNKKIEEGRQEVQNAKELSGKMEAINADLEKVTKERDELQKRYETANKDKEALVEQLGVLKSRRQETPVTSVQQPAPSAGGDEAYWGGVLRAKTDLEMQLVSIRNELKTAQLNTEQFQREKSNLEMEISGLTRENQELKRQMEYNKKIMDSISSELVIEKNDKFQIEGSLRTVKAENDVLRRQLKSLTSRRINLERKIAQLQTENKRLEGLYSEMDSLLKDSVSQIDNLKKQVETVQIDEQQQPQAETEKRGSVELPPIVVRPQGPQNQSPTASMGKVLAINRDNNFAIIDFGQQQGSKVGDMLGVYRDGTRIADIEVIRTSSTVSACDIKREIKQIAIGDIVR